MPLHDELKAIKSDLHPRKFFTGWLRGALLVLIFAALAYVSEAGPLTITLVSASVALLCFLIIDRASDKESAYKVGLFVAFLGLAGLVWAIWQRHQAAAAYKLIVDNYTILRDGRPVGGENRVTGINAKLVVGNSYSFPIYYKIVRQYVRINGKAGRIDNPGAYVDDLQPGHAIDLISELVPADLPNGQYHEANVEFEILYGDTPDLGRRFRYTANWQFFLCVQSGLLCGPVTSTGESIVNEKYS